MIQSLYRMLLSLDEVVDKRWDFWPWDKNTLGWGFVVLDFLSESQGDLDDEASDSFYQNHYYSYLGNYTRTFQPSDFRLSKDTKVILGRGIHPLSLRPVGPTPRREADRRALSFRYL